MIKMKKTLLILVVLNLYTITNAFAEREIKSYYFHDIAITEVDNYDSIDTEKMYKKIVIQKIIPPSTEEIKTASKSLTGPPVKLGETMWEITPQMLPADENTCLDSDISICIETPRESKLYGCYNGCIEFGPTFLSYDEQHKKIYLLGDTVVVGQKSGFFLGFVADLNTKKITFLKKIAGYVKGTISPDGHYILLNGLHGRNILTLYNTKTNNEILVDEHKVTDNLKWLNNEKFRYRIHNNATTNAATESYTIIEKRVKG